MTGTGMDDDLSGVSVFFCGHLVHRMHKKCDTTKRDKCKKKIIDLSIIVFQLYFFILHDNILFT